jgi:hypothetical protein
MRGFYLESLVIHGKDCRGLVTKTMIDCCVGAPTFILVMERNRGNLISDKADFADVASSYGEKIQRSMKPNLPIAAH